MQVKVFRRLCLAAGFLTVGIHLSACSEGLFIKKAGSGAKNEGISRVANSKPLRFESIQDVNRFFDSRTNPYMSIYIDYDSDEASEDVSYSISDSLGSPISDFDLTSEEDSLLVGSTARQYYSQGDMAAIALVMKDKDRNLGVNEEEFASTDLEIFVKTLEDFEEDLAGLASPEPVSEDDINNFIDPSDQVVFLPPGPVLAEVEDDVLVEQTPNSPDVVDPTPNELPSGAADAIEIQQDDISFQTMSANGAGLPQDLLDTLSTTPTLAGVVQNDVFKFESNYGSAAYVDPSSASVTENPKVENLPDGLVKVSSFSENQTTTTIVKPDGTTEIAYGTPDGSLALVLSDSSGANGANVIASYSKDSKTGAVVAKLAVAHPLGNFAIASGQQTQFEDRGGSLWLVVLDQAGKKIGEFNCGAKKSETTSTDIAECITSENEEDADEVQNQNSDDL